MLRVQLLHPATFRGIPNTERDCLFHVTDNLPVAIILGMPYLSYCTVQLDAKRLVMTNKRKSVFVPFADKYSFFSHVACLADDAKNLFDAAVQRNINLQNEFRKNPDGLQEHFGRLKNITINDKLPSSVRSEISILIDRYKHVFQLRTDVGSLFKNGDHESMKIHLSSRVFQPLPKYPIPESVFPELEKQMNDWLAADIVEPMKCHGEFLSPLLAVPKKSGETRFVLDTRAINSITIPMRFNPPKIMDLVRRAAGYRFYTTLDIASFFLSFRLDERSRPLVSF